ncbi:elongation factor Tu [Striga asiatica]|uniref:Elongation factor Tu n=1 Tax=Striga asiatica TaxID=4170 RepID=A0A5A7QX23_STRAF|nr:elongation factor Tu [Striga asiatica]
MVVVLASGKWNVPLVRSSFLNIEVHVVEYHAECKSDRAGALALREAILLAQRLNVPNVVVMGNSFLIVQDAFCLIDAPSSCSQIIDDIYSLRTIVLSDQTGLVDQEPVPLLARLYAAVVLIATELTSSALRYIQISTKTKRVQGNDNGHAHDM